MQNSKEWIKECITSLRRQAGYAFNHDVFISILLCLISDQDRHLILQAPPDRLTEVAQMATQIASGLFGLTAAGHICQPNQTADDLFRALLSMDPSMPPSRDTSRQSDRILHRTTRSTQAASFHSFSSDLWRRSSLKEEDQSDITPSPFQHHSHHPPVSPIDFSLKNKRSRDPHLARNSHSQRDMTGSFISRQSNRARWSDHEESMRYSNRLAQTWVIQGLDTSNDILQSALLELMITKELRISNTRYNVPKSCFLVIVVLPQPFDRYQISSHLLDRFFISYRFREEMLDAIPQLPYPIPMRRIALMRSEGRGGIKELSAKAAKVHVSVDITRYIRDIVVTTRAHPLIQGRLSARASQDLVCVTRCLAAIYGQDYLTPDLVLIAVEKVLNHRVYITVPDDDNAARTIRHKRDLSSVLKEVLEVISVPV